MDGGFTATQRYTRPSVYLDVCALRALAENNEHSARFAGALGRKNGTLFLGSMTIFEFASFSEPRHAAAVDRLLQKIWRHLYFIRCEPFEVIARENRMQAGEPIMPLADEDLLTKMLTHFREQSGQPLSLMTMFSRQSAFLRPTLDDFAHGVGAALLELRRKLEADKGLRRSADQILKTSEIRPIATQGLLHALIKPLHDDRPPARSTIIDFVHAVVPSAYADFVVLDRRWASAVSQATQRLRRAGHHAHIARAFTPGDASLEEFLTVLEG
jgi:hypothetical protein